MRTEKIKIYKFEELGEEAKKIAREWYKECMSNDFQVESEIITENLKETATDEMHNMIEDLNVAWSLSNCQGDGVSFTGKIITENVISFLKLCLGRNLSASEAEVAKFIDYIEFTRNNRVNYVHKYTVDVYLEVYIPEYYKKDGVNTILDNLGDAIESKRIDLCDKLEAQGNKEIDYLYSDDSVDDNIICNEYEFYGDGTKY